MDSRKTHCQKKEINWYCYPKAQLDYRTKKVQLAHVIERIQGFIVEIGKEYTLQLKEEVGKAHIILGLAIYSKAMKSIDIDKWVDIIMEEQYLLED